jgi:hypothetical protein
MDFMGKWPVRSVDLLYWVAVLIKSVADAPSALAPNLLIIITGTR